MDFLWYVGGVALFFWVFELGFRAIRWVVLRVAILLGWRPKIYNAALAKWVVEAGINELRRERAEAGETLEDNQRELMERYGEWLIEIYTANYTLGKSPISGAGKPMAHL